MNEYDQYRWSEPVSSWSSSYLETCHHVSALLCDNRCETVFYTIDSSVSILLAESTIMHYSKSYAGRQ